MGGRGASSGGFAGGGGISSNDIVSRANLISEREGKQSEVDAVLTVQRYVFEQYGVDLSDTQIATMKGKGQMALAFYDSNGNLAVNKNFFDHDKMNRAHDRGVERGFHPGRGNKSGIEAVAAHEMGHRLTDVAGQNAGLGTWQVDRAAGQIVRNAAKATGHKNGASLAAKISGYAKENAAEAVAEAFADVYCNGRKASRESRAVVTELNKYFGR